MANRYAADPFSRAVAWLRRPRSKAVECAWIFVFAAVGAFTIRAQVLEARYIPSRSMEPTLRIDDRLLVEKIGAHFWVPKRGDILVFNPPPLANDIHNALIKRVIGLPGEKVAIHAGKVWINGKPLNEPYVMEGPKYPEPDWERLGMPNGLVPLRGLFMMGDNRNNSQDSHVFGPVPIDNVVGHPFLRFWPPASVGRIWH
ncbi:MAG: lepB2 [Cyanobacteria bacterium RYN_339]|nr:lepB2 [Cyanobacteria bacterium RYN_339]